MDGNKNLAKTNHLGQNVLKFLKNSTESYKVGPKTSYKWSDGASISRVIWPQLSIYMSHEKRTVWLSIILIVSYRDLYHLFHEIIIPYETGYAIYSIPQPKNNPSKPLFFFSWLISHPFPPFQLIYNWFREPFLPCPEGFTGGPKSSKQTVTTKGEITRFWMFFQPTLLDFFSGEIQKLALILVSEISMVLFFRDPVFLQQKTKRRLDSNSQDWTTKGCFWSAQNGDRITGFYFTKILISG